GVGVMLAMRGMTWNLDRDGVLDHVLAIVCAERNPGDPGAEECTSCLEFAPARQLALGKEAFVLCGLLGTDVDDDDVEFGHDAHHETGEFHSAVRVIFRHPGNLAALTPGQPVR